MKSSTNRQVLGIVFYNHFFWEVQTIPKIPKSPFTESECVMNHGIPGAKWKLAFSIVCFCKKLLNIFIAFIKSFWPRLLFFLLFRHVQFVSLSSYGSRDAASLFFIVVEFSFGGLWSAVIDWKHFQSGCQLFSSLCDFYRSRRHNIMSLSISSWWHCSSKNFYCTLLISTVCFRSSGCWFTWREHHIYFAQRASWQQPPWVCQPSRKAKARQQIHSKGFGTTEGLFHASR